MKLKITDLYPMDGTVPTMGLGSQNSVMTEWRPGAAASEKRHIAAARAARTHVRLNVAIAPAARRKQARRLPEVIARLHVPERPARRAERENRGEGDGGEEEGERRRAPRPGAPEASCPARQQGGHPDPHRPLHRHGDEYAAVHRAEQEGVEDVAQPAEGGGAQEPGTPAGPGREKHDTMSCIPKPTASQAGRGSRPPPSNRATAKRRGAGRRRRCRGRRARDRRSRRCSRGEGRRGRRRPTARNASLVERPRKAFLRGEGGRGGSRRCTPVPPARRRSPRATPPTTGREEGRCLAPGRSEAPRDRRRAPRGLPPPRRGLAGELPAAEQPDPEGQRR